MVQQPMTPRPVPPERLQKVMAHAGVGSRRLCEELILAGRVLVDGSTATIGQRVDPAVQHITVDGCSLSQPSDDHEYWVLNKPAGVVSSARDPQGRPTVVDLVPSASRLYPVGRLDLDTTGVILLTNDGELAHRLAHPRYQIDKEYRVVVRGRLQETELRQLERGLLLEDGLTAPARVKVLQQSGDLSELALVLHEGRKRQVRRMVEATGHSVLALHRRRVGTVDDRGLAAGRARRLSGQEVSSLRRAVALAPNEGR